MTFDEYKKSLKGLMAWMPDEYLLIRYREDKIVQFFKKCENVIAKDDTKSTGFERYFRPNRKF